MRVSLPGAKDLTEALKKLKIVLKKLTFEDNFESFKQKDIQIEPGATVTIRNKLTFIPTQYIITSQVGNSLVTKTGTWTMNNLYLINNGANPVTLTVQFLK